MGVLLLLVLVSRWRRWLLVWLLLMLGRLLLALLRLLLLTKQPSARRSTRLLLLSPKGPSTAAKSARRSTRGTCSPYMRAVVRRRHRLLTPRTKRFGLSEAKRARSSAKQPAASALLLGLLLLRGLAKRTKGVALLLWLLRRHAETP